ncbi:MULTISPECIES: permease [Saliphagus]|uniref:Permease n=1 Tax=Saliphagus infecundisoli TaxID=1849069 RepID=A0ABD5QL38_9EURY|nr:MULTISPECIES: permease [Saliphagus]
MIEPIPVLVSPPATAGGGAIDPVLAVGRAFAPGSSGGFELAVRLVGLLGAVLADVAYGVRIAVGMAWDSWWALVFGFTVTGAIREFVPEDVLVDYLGDDGWREIGYGTLFGASSSSCSFSAVATTRSLFAKGGSAAATLGVFQFAATDLVVELGLVLVILLGWQFLAAEVVGGLVAVVAVGVFYRRYVPAEWVAVARRHARSFDDPTCATCGMEVDLREEDSESREFDGERRYFCCGGCLGAYDPPTEAVTAGPELLSPGRWRAATANTIAEWEMLRRDIALGFLIAGLLAAVVPDPWWATAFGVGADGSATRVFVHVLMGTVIGSLTFLCSVGNVPFAVVLWTNGVSFGAVLAFVFADLLIPPLVRTYRRYYGSRMAAVVTAAFFLAAVVGGLAAHAVFGLLGLIPSPDAAGGSVPGTYTALLNVVATPLLAVQIVLTMDAQRRRRLADRLAPHVAGVLYRTHAVLERVAYALENRGLR